jgi:hypothetical protein
MAKRNAKVEVRPRALIEVNGGVAEVTYTAPGDGEPQVEIFDWDNFKDDIGSFALEDYDPWAIKHLEKEIRDCVNGLLDEEEKKDFMKQLSEICDKD